MVHQNGPFWWWKMDSLRPCPTLSLQFFALMFFVTAGFCLSVEAFWLSQPSSQLSTFTHDQQTPLQKAGSPQCSSPRGFLLWSFLVLILSLLDSLILWNMYFLVSTYLAFLICVCVCGIIVVSWCLFLGTKVLKMYFQIYWRQSSNIFTSKHY